jgi:hypothetical protein
MTMAGAWRIPAGLIALLVLAAPPAQAQWRRAESPNFIVYSVGSEAALRERIISLEDFDQLLRALTTVKDEPAPNKLHVYVVRGTRELRAVHPVRDDVAGFYQASSDGIAAFVDARMATSVNEFLFHEYAHHYMSQYAAAAYPAWYVEGSAEYFSTAEFAARHVELGRYPKYRAGFVLAKDWLPMERVLFGDTRELGPEEAQRLYAQSWLLVHYFFSTAERLEGLRRYLGAISRGADWRTAFETEVGLDADGMTARLRDYIFDRRISAIQLPRSSARAPPPVTVTIMPSSAKDLMLFEAALRVGIPADDRDAQLERIRKAAARHDSEPFAQRVLAHAEARYGDAAAADRLLESLLAAAPDDAELMYLKGVRHLNAAELYGPDRDSELRLARQWFVRAHQADGNHFQTLFRYAQSLEGTENYLSENTANVLLLAHQLAPQVGRIRAVAASVLIRRGEYQQAEAILAPLAANAHDPETADWARMRIEQARTLARTDDAGDGRGDNLEDPR